MIVIRKHHMKAFDEARRAELPPKIVRHLRRICPHQTKRSTDADLESFVTSALTWAARHGIETEWDLCRYCWLAFVHGPCFDVECDWARTVLVDLDHTATERMNFLEHYHQNHLAPAARA